MHKRNRNKMPTKNIERCPYENKVIILPSGEVIESPCCKSPYCKRCCWYRKWKLHQEAPHRSVVLDCFQTYLVVPYYKPVPRDVKKRINGFFWRGMRKHCGPLAYLHSLEQQGGLLHGNWHVLSDRCVDPQYVFTRWGEALGRYARISFKAKDGYCDSAISPQKVTEYVLKYYDKDPAEYLPERGRYRKVVYPSPNYNEYVLARTGDTLVGGLFEEQQ